MELCKCVFRIHPWLSPFVNCPLCIIHPTKEGQLSKHDSSFSGHAYCFVDRGGPKCWKYGWSSSEITSYVSLTWAETKVVMKNPSEDCKNPSVFCSALRQSPTLCASAEQCTDCSAQPVVTSFSSPWSYGYILCAVVLSFWFLDKSCQLHVTLHVTPQPYKSGLLCHLLPASQI